MTGMKKLLLVIEQHEPPSTRFVVRYRGGRRAFNTFAEVKEYLRLINLFDGIEHDTFKNYSQSHP